MPVQIGQVARLTEVLDAERLNELAAHPAEPAERRRMAVDHRDQAGIRRQGAEQALDRGAGTRIAGPASLLGGVPAGVQPVRRGDREQAGAGNIVQNVPVCGHRLGRHRAAVDDRQLGARRRFP